MSDMLDTVSRTEADSCEKHHHTRHHPGGIGYHVKKIYFFFFSSFLRLQQIFSLKAHCMYNFMSRMWCEGNYVVNSAIICNEWNVVNNRNGLIEFLITCGINKAKLQARVELL